VTTLPASPTPPKLACPECRSADVRLLARGEVLHDRDLPSVRDQVDAVPSAENGLGAAGRLRRLVIAVFSRQR
jgi:hypothetical protein